MKVSNSLGLSIEFLENGSVKHIEADPIRISLKTATPLMKSGANIFLRKRSDPFVFKPLMGPESNSSHQLTDEGFCAIGTWAGLDYSCNLQLSTKSLSWQWQIDIENTTSDPVEIDLIYLLDVGLKPMAGGLINEYYVSQYLERLVLEDPNYGAVICCRQNMKESVGYPWLMIASKNFAANGSVDGMQFYGKSYRETGLPEGLLSDNQGGNYAGESSIIALKEKPFKLGAGSHSRSAFATTYLPDHQKATSANDLKQLPELFLEFNLNPDTRYPIPDTRNLIPDSNLFNTSQFLPIVDLTSQEIDQYFGNEKRHCDTVNGQLLSFFSGQGSHVVLRAKETLADRPHAHIMQANTGFTPDENIVSTTAFAFGVFNSHLSQGNTNFNVLLSVCTSQFNVSRESGQRIFVELDGLCFLLGVPSAFEMGLNYCRWIYKTNGYCFQVRTWTSVAEPRVNTDFKVINGPKVRLLITHDFDTLNGWKVIPGVEPHQFIAMPEAGSLISSKFPNAGFKININSHQSDYKAGSDELIGLDRKSPSSLFVLDVSNTNDFCLSFIGEVCREAPDSLIESADNQWLIDCQAGQTFWHQMSCNLVIEGDQKDTRAIAEILPWYGMNALTHFLTPYGLEQFSGAAWGTRDVSQGPLDLLLTLEKYDAAKMVLKTIFSNQNVDGGWPQWWMFDSYSHVRAQDSHGDVFYWVIIALSNYIKVTGDLKILDQEVPYFHESVTVNADKTSVSEHVERLIKMIINSFIPGTSLVPFGGGDWNDSLQPVSKDLAQRMISSWTVEMNYQAFKQYQAIYQLAGNTIEAERLKNICENIKTDFNKYLVRDCVVAGYGLVEEDDTISLMLHPSDIRTGVHYSLLPMERGIISEIFTDEQAAYHQELIENHLMGPDGARLMDRPLKYQGGLQTIFQRAESSTFFGREIGLMYVHEHIRYAESLALTGKAEAFVKALRQAIPVDYNEIVPCGDKRQSNCYYSSSDVVFKSRYEADELYDVIKSGDITLRGGWRVYSSGPGIYVSLMITRLLGLRIEFEKVIIDPVIPHSMDGLSASIDFMGHSITFRYAVRQNNYSPKCISINGTEINFTLGKNNYRNGGSEIPTGSFLALLNKQENIVEIQL